MIHTECSGAVDSSGRELQQHGTAAFPVGCYYDDLTKESVPWHWHDEWEAVVVAEGSTIVAAGNEKFIVEEGDAFFINAGILHACWTADPEKCRYHSLVFHPRLIGGSLDSVFYRDYARPLMENRSLESLILHASHPWHREAIQAIENAWQACCGEPPGYEFLVRDNLSRLAYLLQVNHPSGQNSPGPRALRSEERMKAMLQFVQSHYASPITTAQIAGSAAISESECLRCFRSVIGTTPIQYLREYRLQQAAQLLTATELRIADIAAQCGFQDISYFTKTFRELKGCVPTQYRQMNKP